MSDREIINAEIGQRLREARLSAQMTLEEAGEKIGISGSVLRRYEIGTIKSISIDIVKKFAKTYNVSAFSLLGWKNNSSSPIVYQTSFSEEEEKMIKKYRCLPPEVQATVKTLIDIQYEAVKPVKSETVG